MAAELYFWGKTHSDILSQFINAMNCAELKYFILRNYEGLPEQNTSKDVDVVIEPGTYSVAKNLLLSSFRDNMISDYYIMDFERAHCIFGMSVDAGFAIHIDLIEGYANKGFEILSFAQLYDKTIRYKDFRVLEPAMDAVMLILYKVIGCKELKRKYRDKISDTYKEYGYSIKSILYDVLRNDLGEKVVTCIENNDYERLLSYSKNINRVTKTRVFFHRPLRTIIDIIKFLWEKFERMIICPSSVQKLIVVEAPDGTGKTTFIDALVTEIARYFVCDRSKSVIRHFRPLLLPNLGAAEERLGVMKQDKNFTEPHRARPANALSSFLRMTYYWFDYVIGMPLLLRKDAQFDKFTIFDRYAYDFLVDPFRTRIKLPHWIRMAFVKTLKQPKIVFVLDAPVDVIYARKQELEKLEINRQLVEFHKLKKLGNRVHILDATHSPQLMAKEAIKIIIKRIANQL